AVGGVEHATDAQRQAAATDARVEVVAEALQQADTRVKQRSPRGGEPLPLRRGGGAIFWQRREGASNLVEREANALRGLDARKPAGHVTPGAALAARSRDGRDEPAMLVEAERGGGEAGARRRFAPGQPVVPQQLGSRAARGGQRPLEARLRLERRHMRGT